jgi:uncharacterized phage-like protein YoqJ
VIVAFTGHRPDKLGPIEDKIDAALDAILERLNPTRAISGMAPGIDVRGLRAARRKGIPVTAAIPWIGHPFSGPWEYGAKIDLYYELLEQCDVHEVVCDGDEYYQPWFYQKRNEWMVDNCDAVIAVWDGSGGGTKNCVKYARKVGRPIWYYNWNDRSWIYEYLPV